MCRSRKRQVGLWDVSFLPSVFDNNNNCAKRLYVRSGSILISVRSFVRPSVRSFVRKFWDFCEGDMEVSRIELSTGTLKHGFLGVPKKDARKVALRVTIRTFRDPILDHFF